MSHVESLDAAKSKGPEIFFFFIYILTNSTHEAVAHTVSKEWRSKTTCRVSLSSLYST